MPEPKIAESQHWESVSDEDLLARDLTTENPLGLEGLVSHLPDGPEEPHVEFSYDLDDEVRCVHGNHRHKHGFVFRKGDYRYLVGWMCGEKLYGQKFTQYTADFRAAQSRQDAMRRVRDIQVAVDAFSIWATGPHWQASVDSFDELRRSLAQRMPVVFQIVQENAGKRIDDAPMPRYLCYPIRPEFVDTSALAIAEEYIRFIEELRYTAAELIKPPAAVVGSIGKIVEELRGVARRANVLLSKFDDVELFFQPSVLHAICNQIAGMRPLRAKHFPGLLKITTKNVVIAMPPDFRPPARRGLEDFEAALNAGK